MKRNDRKTDPLSPEILLPLISTAYYLTEPVTCDWLTSGLNDVFEVTTGNGPYILKVYRAGWRTREEVLDEIAALLHLDRKGVRVALPIARRDGAFVWTLTLPARERQAVLFACAHGKEISAPNVSCCHLFGQTLAQVHNASDDFTGAPVRYDIKTLLAHPLRALEPYLDDRSDDRNYLRRLVSRLQQRIESLPPGTLDWGYCHGDFRAANLRLDEATGAVTVFDFELGGTGFRSYDIAYTQTNLHSLALELLWGAPALEDHELCWTAFLDGYAERRPLRAADRETIPLFVAMRPVRIMGTLLQTARQNLNLEPWPPSEEGGLPGGDLFDRALRFLRAWEKAYL